jgi:hypothetical protein
MLVSFKQKVSSRLADSIDNCQPLLNGMLNFETFAAGEENRHEVTNS